MFLRFTVRERDLDSDTWQGLFVAAYEVVDRSRWGHAALQEALDWFTENLPVPGCYGPEGDPRAICWFRPTASQPLAKMWKLVAFLRTDGALVQLHKTKDPGQWLYSDPFQVVAIPQWKQRIHTIQLR